MGDPLAPWTMELLPLRPGLHGPSLLLATNFGLVISFSTLGRPSEKANYYIWAEVQSPCCSVKLEEGGQGAMCGKCSRLYGDEFLVSMDNGSMHPRVASLRPPSILRELEMIASLAMDPIAAVLASSVIHGYVLHYLDSDHWAHYEPLLPTSLALVGNPEDRP